MSEKRFEEEKSEVCEYDYTTLDTYYEARDNRIIEWNKYSSNAEYFDFSSISRLLNIKEMRLESCQKGKLRMSDVLKENEQLRNELKKITEILENGGVLLTEKQLLSICENKEIWNVDPVTDTVLKG